MKEKGLGLIGIEELSRPVPRKRKRFLDARLNINLAVTCETSNVVSYDTTERIARVQSVSGLFDGKVFSQELTKTSIIFQTIQKGNQFKTNNNMRK